METQEPQLTKQDGEKLQAMADIEATVGQMEVLFLTAKAENKFACLNDMTTQVLRFWVMSLPNATKNQQMKKLEGVLFNFKKAFNSMVDAKIEMAIQMEAEKKAANEKAKQETPTAEA